MLSEILTGSGAVLLGMAVFGIHVGKGKSEQSAPKPVLEKGVKGVVLQFARDFERLDVSSSASGPPSRASYVGVVALPPPTAFARSDDNDSEVGEPIRHEVRDEVHEATPVRQEERPWWEMSANAVIGEDGPPSAVGGDPGQATQVLEVRAKEDRTVLRGAAALERVVETSGVGIGSSDDMLAVEDSSRRSGPEAIETDRVPVLELEDEYTERAFVEEHYDEHLAALPEGEVRSLIAQPIDEGFASNAGSAEERVEEAIVAEIPDLRLPPEVEQDDDEISLFGTKPLSVEELALAREKWAKRVEAAAAAQSEGPAAPQISWGDLATADSDGTRPAREAAVAPTPSGPEQGEVAAPSIRFLAENGGFEAIPALAAALTPASSPDDAWWAVSGLERLVARDTITEGLVLDPLVAAAAALVLVGTAPREVYEVFLRERLDPERAAKVLDLLAPAIGYGTP